jgi:hypothetical protein
MNASKYIRAPTATRQAKKSAPPASRGIRVRQFREVDRRDAREQTADAGSADHHERGRSNIGFAF